LSNLNTSFVFQAMGMSPTQADKPSRPGFCRRQNTGLARAVRSVASEGCDSVRTKQMALFIFDEHKQ
jgi:hypothetical protein